MAKGALLTIDGAHRKIKTGYITIDSVYHKLKSAYITIGGVYRPFWNIGLSRYGMCTDLSVGRYALAATTIGKVALFGGGFGPTSKVDAYDASRTRRDVTALQSARYDLAAATNGIYAVFAGGRATSSSSGSTMVDFYDAALTRTTPNAAFSPGRYYHAAASLGNMAMFAGGYNGTGASAAVTYWMGATAYLPLGIGDSRYSLAGTAVDGYAIFAGGIGYGTYYATVSAYDSEGSNVSVSDKLSKARRDLAATAVGDYAIFAGGKNTASGALTNTDAYDSSLTKIASVPSLSVARANLAATTVGDFAIFAGGYDSTNTDGACRNEVDVYDINLTHSVMTPLRDARWQHAAVTIGNYALFAGGKVSDGTETATVEAYTV